MPMRPTSRPGANAQKFIEGMRARMATARGQRTAPNAPSSPAQPRPPMGSTTGGGPVQTQTMPAQIRPPTGQTVGGVPPPMGRTTNMKKGGKVKMKAGGKVAKYAEGGTVRSQGLRSARANRLRDDDLESRYGSQEKGRQSVDAERRGVEFPPFRRGGIDPDSAKLPRGMSVTKAARRQYKRGGKVKGRA